MTRAPSILIVAPYGFNDRMANFMECIASRILARNGWHVTGIARRERGEPAHQTVHGVDVVRYCGTLAGAALVTRLFLTRRFDVVHVFTLRNNRAGVFAAMFAKFWRIPLVCSEAGLLHDHYLVDDRDNPLGKPLQYENVVSTLGSLVIKTFRMPRRFVFFLRSYLFHFALTHADHTVFFSKHNIAIAERLYLHGIRYIPQALDSLRFEPTTSAPAREEIDAVEKKLPNEPYALFVGQLKLRKGWDVLLRAVPQTPYGDMPKFVFVSTSGRETEPFTALVEKLQVRDRIVFLGALRHNETARHVFKKSALVAVPSRYEGFGLVPFDAFEAGVPVVASHVEALADFLKDGINALLVPPDNPSLLARAIAVIARDHNLHERLLAGGRETLQEFRDNIHAQKWLDFYQSMLRTRTYGAHNKIGE